MNYIIKISELPRNKICYKLNIWPCTFTKDFPCITEPAIKKYLIKIREENPEGSESSHLSWFLVFSQLTYF